MAKINCNLPFFCSGPEAGYWDCVNPGAGAAVYNQEVTQWAGPGKYCKYWPLIGQYWSRDTNTVLWLVQALPPDTGDKLASVELQAEKTAADLEDQETEHKKAKNVRYEFQVLYCIMLFHIFHCFHVFDFMMT